MSAPEMKVICDRCLKHVRAEYVKGQTEQVYLVTCHGETRLVTQWYHPNNPTGGHTQAWSDLRDWTSDPQGAIADYENTIAQDKRMVEALKKVTKC